ncbi:hypothetical protein Aaci_1172 [Alicyclobacillus acidocaldarius subsp. acidocaldarius DSM 446]|uniref:Lipoprotein n=1 Tax=Alicyclobacillus acidocaldarius subsp. acidocaldarius (strain ATCC 27009 / DSM 446 / BCRC 14685 / JCM 5260 / KCTC 1825 / NBRC 15652 / NCIMB 11725 / NRRL B-14509 / 104-IA) TaxID=521098 RepID=C8WVT1_ALIAD|nr:hypothetical protein Aaci_1172 [Alicyclobacillus acidocaldarius subsp. acidocaldarius DSM 446]
MKRVGWLLVSLAVSIGGLTGCGTYTVHTTHPEVETQASAPPVSASVSTSSSTKSSIHPDSKTSPAKEVPVVMKSLPTGMVSHLQPYAQRIQHVSALPVHVPSSVQNVLILSGVTAYAIPQFQSIWSQLPNKPAVVWVGLTPSQTKSLWKQAGYHTDPLPSPVTLYEDVQLPVPVAYHKVKGGWEELPGILPSSQVHDWVTFFKGGTS